MKTTINESSNLCGYYIGKPLRVTKNSLGKTWVEPVGWNSEQQTWLEIPHTKPGYIGPEMRFK